MIESLFENFNIKSVYSTCSNVTGLYYEGITTGYVLDCGYSGNFGLGIFEGFPIMDKMSSNREGGFHH